MHTRDELKPGRTNLRQRRPKRLRKLNAKDSICEALLATVVVGSALAIGTVHIAVLLAVSALALLGGALELMTLRRVPRPALVLAAFALFSAGQAVPLPAAWVSRASPISASVWLQCLVPFGESALRRFSLSLDPGASVAEALKWCTYACVYIMATRTRARRGSGALALLLFGSAVLVTLITLLHGVADLSELYGVYQPHDHVDRWSVGPLLNANNLAGYAILGLFSGGGLLLSDRSPVPRLPLAIGIGVIATALSLSGSRAAVLSMLAAGAVILVWLARGRQAMISPLSVTLGLAPVVIGIVIAIVLGSAREAGGLMTLDVQRKVSVWLWSAPMIRDHVVFGVGRGAFETAFSSYRQALDYDWSIVVTHAENFVVQWLAEWGAPVGLCAVVLIVGYVLREWYRNKNDRLRFMVMTGLVALFLQNLADLGFEIPALAIAAVLALAAGERTTPAAAHTQKRLGAVAWAVAAPIVLLWVATFVWSRFPVEAERRALSGAYRALPIKSATERERFRTQLKAAVLRHPAEPFFPLLGSLVAARTGNANALTWAARSLELGPMNGSVHLVLADLLHAHGATTQAMLHLRLAAQYDRTLGGAVSGRAPAWAPSVDVLLQAIPEGPRGESVLLDACGQERNLEVKTDCFRRAVMRDGTSLQARQQLGEVLLSAMQGGQPPCAEAALTACAAEADTAVQGAEKLGPNSWRLGYLAARLRLAHGDAVGAAQLLTRVCPAAAEGDECWHAAVVAALKSRSDSAIAAAAKGYAARPCDGMEACADRLTSLGSALEVGGESALANTFFTKAAEADPSAARWLKVAEHAADDQLYGVARAAADRADRSPDASVSSRAGAELLRERVARATAEEAR